MERIASFCVDHTRLLPGMYLSRQDGADGEILTWDIRMKQPNKGSYLSPAAAHTLEHLFATYARNSKYSRGVVYVGPMGCLTGFYLLTTGLTPAEALDLTRSAFAWMAEYEGEIPGASAVECGNYLMMDPIAARAEAAAMLPVRAKKESLSHALVASVSAAGGAMLAVCAFIAFFGAAADMICLVFPSVPSLLRAVICSFFEISRGCAEFSGAAELSPLLRYVGVAFALGFSGVSVACQISERAGEISISVLPYLAKKLIFGLAMAASGGIFAIFVL